MKASIIERFNRTLKNDMWKQFTHNGNYKWIDLLLHLISEYNARKHRTIDVTLTIANKLLNTVYSSVKAVALIPTIQSDSIRVSKFKTIFEKGYTSNWTMEMFKIVKVQKTNPVMYLLKDYRGKLIAGGF